MKVSCTLSILCAVLLIILGCTATYSLERIDALKNQVTTAKADAERWRVTAQGWQGKVHAQSTLANACLEREAQAFDDAQMRDSILHLGPPAAIPPTEKDKGVSRETRRAAAEYLNRPL